jgi:hypothetical protein
MRSRHLLLVAMTAAVTAVGGIAPTGRLEAAKKPAPSSSDWGCAATFYDRQGDVIRSDGGGAYVNGVSRVECSVYASGAKTGNLHLQPDSRSSRRIHLEGQTYGSVEYGSEDTAAPDYFEVGDLASAVTVGGTYLRPFRVTKGSATNVFRGDSFASGTLYDSSSSVFVTPIDACSWDVEFKPDEPLVTVDADGRAEPTSTWTDPRLLALYSLTTSRGKAVQTLLGYVPMPFGVRIDVIANKPGCPLPAGQ